MNSIDLSSLQKSKRYLCGVSILVLSIIFASCSVPSAESDRSSSSETTTETVTSGVDTVTFTQITTSTQRMYTETPSDDEVRAFETFTQIRVTQGPVVVSTKSTPNSTYLYENVTVDIQFPDSYLYGRRYLNLDDLENNGDGNSDIIFDVTEGSGGKFVSFYPANYAKYYFSGEDEMDYDSCVDQFPAINVYAINNYQKTQFFSGKPYCVLTNEGHMAIVRYAMNPLYPDDQGVTSISVMVTVYQKIPTNIYTPPPTYTPGPGPTPTNKFSVRGLTDAQADELTLKIQDFITAVSNRDKEAILGMLSYPLIVQIGLHDDYTFYDSEEFLSVYDRIFTDEFISETSKATIDDVISSSICLSLKNSQIGIYFTKDGKIREINNYIFEN